MAAESGRTGQRKKMLRRWKIWAVPGILFLFISVKVKNIYGFSFFPDEFAYWTYAADRAGYDWSELVSLGSYFSYGYGWLLYPFFVLCRDAVTAYRAAVCLNFVFLAGTYILLVYMAGEMFAIPQSPDFEMPDRRMSDNPIPLALFSALSVLFPWNLFYAQTTLTESLLVFLYTAVGVLLWQYLKKNQLSVLILLVLVMAYSYMVHMRTVGILLSALAVLLVHVLSGRGKGQHFLAAAVLLAVLFVVSWKLKNYALAHVYGGLNSELAAGNDYSGQLEQLRYICTAKGCRDFAVTVLGGFLYMGMASFGLFYWGLYAWIRDMAGLPGEIRRQCRAVVRRTPAVGRAAKEDQGTGFKEDKTDAVREGMGLFVLLSVLVQVIIASVYLLGRGEIDDYTYGRYSELILPFLCVRGLATLWTGRRRVILVATGLLAVLQGLGLWLAASQVRYTGAETFHGYYMIGISYLHGKGGFETGEFYTGAWVICELLAVTLVILVLTARSGVGRSWILTAMIVLELSLTVHTDTQYFDSFQLGVFRDSRMAEKIEALSEEDRRVFYIHDGGQTYVDLLQFMGRNINIRILERKNGPDDYGPEVLPEDILIFSYEDDFSREWADLYTRRDTYGHFTILYNDAVAGNGYGKKD